MTAPVSTTMAPIGQTIDGGYRIVERLGGGGMGEVYRADHEATRRSAAVKILRGVHRDRFAREAKILKELRHPGIPDFIGSGQLDSGEYYIAMQLIEGDTL